MKTKLLKKIRESNDYISGQLLCSEFGVSRTAIWKVIHQLEEEGYRIEAVRNKGYRLLESPDVISREEISCFLDTAWAGREIHYFPEIDSTNIRARQLGESGACHGTLVTAECQKGGKGRRGRGWVSPTAGNIYMTLLLRPDIRPDKAPMLTLVMAYAVAAGISEETGVAVQIKWPNDILVNGKKVCGILTEMSTEIDYINYVVIGVGVNSNMSSFPDELSEKATSLCLETGKVVHRAQLIAAVLKHFEAAYEPFIEHKDLRGIQEEYNQLLVNRGRNVKILLPEREYQAYALGIDHTGKLLVKKETGETEAIFAGEVSVRGVDGYI